MKIVKTELLWSRACKYRCSGCGMRKEITHKLPDLDLWQKGFEELKALGNEFVAIYGAEPLERFEGLPEIVEMIKRTDMDCTIITAYHDPEKMSKLVSNGLDSVTTSLDVYGDQYRTRKMLDGLETLQLTDVSDKACVITASLENQRYLLAAAGKILKSDYWLLFDLMHGDNGNGKCRGQVPSPEKRYLDEFLDYLIDHKQKGMKVHPSLEYLEYLKAHYTDNPRKVWHCRGKEIGWLTVDFDGTVYPCDDWQSSNGIKVWELAERWGEFESFRAKEVEKCPGCSWNTHFDAVNITRTGNIGTYVHSKVKR